MGEHRDRGEDGLQGTGKRRRARIALWGGGLLLLALLGAGAVGVWLAPRLVQIGALKPLLLAEISRRVGSTVEAQSADFTLWPIPSIQLRSLRLRRPDRGEVTASTATARLALGSLLRGRVAFTSLELDQFQAVVRIPEVPLHAWEESVSLAQVEERVSRALTDFLSEYAGLSLSLRRGAADLSDGKTTRFRLQALEARVASAADELTFSASFRTPRGETVDLGGALAPRTWRGKGRLSVSRLRTDAVAAYLFPRKDGPIAEGEVSSTLRLAAEGRGRLRAGLECTTPSAIVRLPTGELALRHLSGKGTVALSDGTIQAELERFSLASPTLDARGAFGWDPKTARATAELRGRDVDVAAFLRLASRLAPGVRGLGVARDVVREGGARDFTATARATSPRGLLAADAFEIRGTAHDVALHIPGIELEVAQGAGKAVYSRGVLSAADLTGTTAGGVARSGTFYMGLLEANPRLHLELDLSAELGQVYALLRRTVPRNAFARELALVGGVEGSASGRLVVGERLKALKVQVDAGSVKLAASYGRFPFPLDLRARRFVYRGDGVIVEGASGSAGRSTFQEVSGTIGWTREATLRIASAAGRVDLGELYPWLLRFAATREAFRDFGPPVGTLAVEGFSAGGPFLRPSEWRFRLTGAVEGLSVRSSLFPGVLRVARARLEATESDAAVSDAGVALLDSSVRAGARVQRYRSERPAFDAALRGRLGRSTAEWIASGVEIPAGLKIRRASEILRGRVTRSAEGEIAYSGDHLLESGPEVSVDVRRLGERWGLNRLAVRDAGSQADLSLAPTQEGYEIAFRGKLRGQTVDALVEPNPYVKGLLEGDFRTRVDVGRPRNSLFSGWLRATQVEVPRRSGPPLRVEAASLQGDGKTARIESSRLSLGSERFRLAGRVTAAGSGPYEADLALSADEVDAKALAQETEAETRPPASGGKGKPSFLQWLWDAPVRGVMKVDLGRLRYGRLSIAPFQAEVSLAAGRLSADASRLGVCGISLPGRLEATRDGASFQLKAAAKGADLARTLPCLGHASGVMTGSFDLNADLSAKGTLDRPRSLLDSLRGDLTFKAKDGRIFRMGILAKIFAVLNVTEVFRGRMPDLFETGFGYRSIKTKGGIEDGKLVFEEGTLDGASATLFWDGRVNLSTRDTDLTVVVAPLKTVDAIISRIPVVNYLLDRTLLSIPVRVTGDIADPDIVPLAPTAVGRRLLGFMERTLLLPYKVVQPLLPKGDDEKAP